MKCLCIFFMSFFFVIEGTGQGKLSQTGTVTPKFDESIISAVEFRNIGAYRGGRSAAVTGVRNKPQLFYMGSTGGGVWKTSDGGQTWKNISDGFFGGSIGAVAVAESDNNVLYVGGGEVTVRGNVSYGWGMFKSEDAGKTWKELASELKNARHIPRIRIHPTNPDIVYAAVLGDLFKPSDIRGVYKSIDGGKSWKKILFANENAGAVDLILDPNNPRTLYASTWRIRRTPYSLESGGDGSALWKSTDSGETWKNISDKKGLPKGIWGISGITVSSVNSQRMYALIENENGGVYRTDDAGENWTLVNSDRSLRQRAWYYTRIYADTKDQDIVYVMNVNFHKSKDGGKTFANFDTPHGDHHDLWIAPDDNQRLIVADDGGAQISYDGAENWTTYMNQPTAQYYRVVTDNTFPYRIYVAQQDNSTLRISHRTDGNAITERDWQETAGGESAHIAVDPTDNDIVYGGSYDGYLTRINHKTNEERDINVWPDNTMGHGVEDMKYRFQWNFPIFFSPHNPKKLYTTSHQVHVTSNEGQSWEAISPDLTRAEKEKMKPSGGPITKDNTAVEYYATIFTATESPYEKDLLWTGSDDGLVYVTKDAGKNWENVTPTDAPKYIMWNSIEPHPTIKGSAYFAGTCYKSGDYNPYLYRTDNYGKVWKKIDKGIAELHFTRVVRADPNKNGLLYAGTEAGLYISFDDGANWNPLKLNFPVVPVTDITIKNNNLIVATQGRSLWILDDMTTLQQYNPAFAQNDVYLFKPIDSYRMGGQNFGNTPNNAGKNHHNGVLFYCYLKNEVGEKDTITFEILEKNGKNVRTLSTQTKEKADKIELKKGSNTIFWNMRYADAEGFDGLIMWAASLRGPKAIPGTYTAKIKVGKNIQEVNFEILKDPRTNGTLDDIQAQFSLIQSINEKLSQTHRSIKDIRKLREQMNGLKDKLSKDKKYKPILDKIDELNKQMTEIEESLYQTKNKSGQDPLNFPIRLNNKLGHLGSVANSADFKPTEQTLQVKEEITKAIDQQLQKWDKLKNADIPALNKLIKDNNIDTFNF